MQNKKDKKAKGSDQTCASFQGQPTQIQEQVPVPKLTTPEQPNDNSDRPPPQIYIPGPPTANVPQQQIKQHAAVDVWRWIFFFLGGGTGN